MTELDPNAFEEGVIADMREHGGAVTTGPLKGHPLLIMTSRGARSGAERRAILTYSRDGDAYVVAGTAGGAPTTPAWVANVKEHPRVTLEVDTKRIEAEASVALGADRDELWRRHVEALPWFADYPEKSGRVIPMIRLRPNTLS